MNENVEISFDNDEKIINWEEEANGIINDVKTHVAEIKIASELPSNESRIYLNIRTFEGQTYCVQVSSMGFRIVSNTYSTIDEGKHEIGGGGVGGADDEDDNAAMDADEGEEVFETPYALLDKISPSYVKSFGNQLCKQLLNLQQMRTQFNEEDELNHEDDDDDDFEADKDASKRT